MRKKHEFLSICTLVGKFKFRNLFYFYLEKYKATARIFDDDKNFTKCCKKTARIVNISYVNLYLIISFNYMLTCQFMKVQNQGYMKEQRSGRESLDTNHPHGK